MSKKLNISLHFDDDLKSCLKKDFPEMVDFRIISQALDARGANRGKKPKYNYRVEIVHSGEAFEAFEEKFSSIGNLKYKPIIIGAGPAGLFCALRLLEYGVSSTIIERGAPALERMRDISKFWKKGILDPESNVCYGEGGAGLFSDGKLITRIKSPYISYVMNKLVDFGAPENTAYLSNPHLGSNKIRTLINSISAFLKEKGCEIHYHTKMSEILIENGRCYGVKLSDNSELISDHIVLATGHSAKDVYQTLQKQGIPMQAKDFAVGVRVEHPRKVIDKIQHGNFSSSDIGSAKYKLTHHLKKEDRGCFSFCMCPGGYVLSSGTEKEGIVVNGMSNYSRSAPWSNSALVVTVKAGADFSDKGIDGAINFQKNIEKKAWELSKEYSSGRELPSVLVKDYLDGKISRKLPVSSSPSGIFSADLNSLLPNFINNSLRTSLYEFDRKMKGFIHDEAVLIGPETRTSSPVTILRDRDSMTSIDCFGLYPCGEGGGYAGGITSAAVDGVKIAMSIISSEKEEIIS